VSTRDGSKYIFLTLGEDKYYQFFVKKAAPYYADYHTVSRANCYKVGDSKLNQIAQDWFIIQNEHLFHDSVYCANDLFGFNDSTSRLAFLE
jgi:hypothetical protein